MVSDLVCMGTECNVPFRVAQLSVCAFLTILFLQSGLDKVLDWNGNVEWLTDHFSETPFASFVPALVGVITLFELAAGAVSGVGAAILWFTGAKEIALLGITLSAAALLQLFAGQRIAKDYPGAAVLVPYFIVTIIGLVLLVA